MTLFASLSFFAVFSSEFFRMVLKHRIGGERRPLLRDALDLPVQRLAHLTDKPGDLRGIIVFGSPAVISGEVRWSLSRLIFYRSASP